MDSQRASEHAKVLNFLQVMEKETIESTGRRSKIEKRWSGAILLMGDPPLVEVLLLVLASAMKRVLPVLMGTAKELWRINHGDALVEREVNDEAGWAGFCQEAKQK